ncbi:MAG: hypothetical protein ACMG6S_25655 [Byssovorax sp.]
MTRLQALHYLPFAGQSVTVRRGRLWDVARAGPAVRAVPLDAVELDLTSLWS